MSRTCCLPNPWGDSGRLLFDSLSARERAAWCANCSPRACCCFFWAESRAWPWAWPRLRLLLHAAPTGYIPGVISVHLDSRVFGFTFLIAFVTGTLAGLIPALHATRVSFSEMLKESGSAVAASHGLARSLLTAGEIAIALVMLVGAGLATRSLVRLLGVQLGFDPRQVVAGTIPLPDSRYPKKPQQTAFFRNLLDRVQALPGVVSAGAASELPLDGGSNGTVVIEGQPAPKDDWSSPLVELCVISPNYFRTMRIPLLSGRDVAETDTPDTSPVAVINETMAHRFWPHQDAVGKRFKHTILTPSGSPSLAS